jgi:DNA-binding PadR family transcriptional regulator
MNNETNIVLTEAVFYILLVLHKPLHGYGIMQETEIMSGGRLKLSAGTLYGALSSLLEKNGLSSCRWKRAVVEKNMRLLRSAKKWQR